MAFLRMELFPAHLDRAIHFYSTALAFTLAKYEPEPPLSSDQSHIDIRSIDFTLRLDSPISEGYAYLIRNDATGKPSVGLGLATKPLTDYPDAARNLTSRKHFRTWPTGVEIVLEVEDLQAERERILQYEPQALVEDLKYQYWGLWDFRIVDTDGFYLRITSSYGDATTRAGQYATLLGIKSEAGSRV